MATTYTLKLTHQHLSLVVSALAELPYKASAPVLQTIKDQVKAAELAAQDKDADPVATD